MATITSIGTGNWSASGTWDAGVPVDGDAVVIASGHVVTFDVNQSAFSTGISITITGTLTHTTASGTYCLFIKTGGSVTGAGTWNVGTSGTPIPFASKHTITGASGWYVNGNSGGLTMNVYAAEPTTKVIYISGSEAVGQTELSVDTDVTGDIWAAGDTVRINDTGRYESEERTIAAGGIAAGTITITSGLTGDKAAGSSIVLCSRNVMFLGVGSDILKTFQSEKLVIAGGGFTASGRTLVNGTGVAISGGVFYNANYALSGFWGNNISGGVFAGISYPINTSNSIISGGIFTGSNHAVYGCMDIVVSGGTFTCNNNCFYNSNVIDINSGQFFANNKLCERGFDVKVSNITTSTHAQDFNTSTFKAFNVTFGGTTEVYGYSAYNPSVFCESLDHDGVAGAYKAWTSGGVTTGQSSVLPSGYAIGYLTVLESATKEGYWCKPIGVSAGESITVTVNLRKSASMTYLPKAYLMEGIQNPLLGTTPFDSFEMTDSTDAWESDVFTIDNSAGTADKQYILWIVGKNASGNLYSAINVAIDGGGSGSVKIVPLGGVRL